MSFIIATLIVLLVIASVVAQGPDVLSLAYWQEGGQSTSRSEIVRNLGILAAAVIGLGFGIWRAVTAYMQARASQRQAHTAEQGHITDRFSTAVEQLGHDRVAVRIGGLYALKRIAEDSVERDHLAVMDVLTNFIRQPPYTNDQREAAEREKALRAFRTNSAEENAEADQTDRADQTARAAAPPPEPELIDCPDIVAAIEIILSRTEGQKAVEDEREYPPSLNHASLSYLRLLEVDLDKFSLMNANLTGADLREAGLAHAVLEFANLTCANLAGASLLNADLLNADLSGANLTAAVLSGSNVTQEQLDSACIDKGEWPPTLPDGLNPPQKECGQLLMIR